MAERGGESGSGSASAAGGGGTGGGRSTDSATEIRLGVDGKHSLKLVGRSMSRGAASFKLAEGEQKGATTEEVQEMHLRKLFSQFDADGDGFLTGAEAITAVDVGFCEELEKAGVERWLAKFKAQYGARPEHRDGVFNLSEFAELVVELISSSPGAAADAAK